MNIHVWTIIMTNFFWRAKKSLLGVHIVIWLPGSCFNFPWQLNPFATYSQYKNSLLLFAFVVFRQEMLEKLADKFERKVKCLVRVYFVYLQQPRA